MSQESKRKSSSHVPLNPLAVDSYSMQGNSNSNSDADNARDNNQRAHNKIVLAIALGGGVLVLVILFVSIFWPNLIERTKFFTTNALSALVLDLIAIQAYIYTKHWEAMTKQLDAMMYGQRAYITVSGYELEPRQPIAIAKFEFRVENSGNTPASNVEIWHTGGIRQCLPQPSILPSEWTQLGIIAPGGYGLYVLDLTTIMPASFRYVKNGAETYHHEGIIRYRDIFGNYHSTKFCLEIDISGMAPFKGIPCKVGGNEAD